MAEIVDDEICLGDVRKAKDERIPTVHVVATFIKSPNGGLGHEVMMSLKKYIYSEKNVVKKIANVEVEQFGALEMQAKLFVQKNNLWEGASSYVWKHLGRQDFWDPSIKTK